MSARRWWIVTAALIGALAALAFGIVALRGGLVAPAYPVGSPEAVVTEFVQAVVDRDARAARSLLSDEAAARCSPNAFARAVEMATNPFGGAAPRWTFLLQERRELASGAVSVRIRIVRTEPSPPWGVTSQRSDATFVLEGVGDTVRIASFDWPGPCW